MISIQGENIDLTKLEVEDLVDIHVLQKFLDNFAVGVNCAAIAVDRNGTPVTKPSRYTKFCDQFVNASSIGSARCAKCHNEMGEKSLANGKPYIGYCHSGLIDFAAPIIVKGEHIGTVLGGQIITESPQEDQIKRVAREITVSEDDLWDAATKIDIVDRRNIEAAAEVLYIVVNSLAEQGYNKIESGLLSSHLAENFIQVSSTIEVLAQASQNISANQSELSKEITEINKFTQDIEDILKAVSQVANKTKLIGLNASIESARIGNEGRGFAIVANEIQKLAESTKNTTEQISELNNRINAKLDMTMRNSNHTLEEIEEQTGAMEELSATLQTTSQVAEKLKALFNLN